MEMTQMPINRQLAWEDVVYLYNGILLIHKKKKIAICSNVDGLRDDQAEWSKSYRERQVFIIYIWNLKNNVNEYKRETKAQT